MIPNTFSEHGSRFVYQKLTFKLSLSLFLGQGKCTITTPFILWNKFWDCFLSPLESLLMYMPETENKTWGDFSSWSHVKKLVHSLYICNQFLQAKCSTGITVETCTQISVFKYWTIWPLALMYFKGIMWLLSTLGSQWTGLRASCAWQARTRSKTSGLSITPQLWKAHKVHVQGGASQSLVFNCSNSSHPLFSVCMCDPYSHTEKAFAARQYWMSELTASR